MDAGPAAASLSTSPTPSATVRHGRKPPGTGWLVAIIVNDAISVAAYNGFLKARPSP